MDRGRTRRAARVTWLSLVLGAGLLLPTAQTAMATPDVFERGGAVGSTLSYEGGPADDLDSATCPDAAGTVVERSVDVPAGFDAKEWRKTVRCDASWSGGEDEASASGRLDYTETWTGNRLRKVIVLARATADSTSLHQRLRPVGEARYRLVFQAPDEAQIRVQAAWTVRERTGTVKTILDYTASCSHGSIGRAGHVRRSSGSWAGRLVLPDSGETCRIDVAARTRPTEPATAPVRNRIKATLRVTVTLRYCDVVGTSGADRLIGSEAGQVMCGRGGADVIRGNGGNDIIIGGPGNDRLFGDAGHDRILGGDGEDRIVGGTGKDTIDGGDDDDWLRGDAGDDELRAGRGDDMVLGGPGDDLLHGDEGFDVLEGQQGADRLYGGKGPDTLCGDEGPDRLYGGIGHDAAGGGGGRDRVFGGDGSDILSGNTVPTGCRRSGVDLADVVSGGSGDDEVVGGPGADKLTGGAGKDRLAGGSGNDTLSIKDGERDRANGGPGRDRLRGGRDAADVVSSVP